jgi:hypothetical protein
MKQRIIRAHMNALGQESMRSPASDEGATNGISDEYCEEAQACRIASRCRRGSALGRDVRSGPYDNFIQIDAPVNKGNSGGPTFDVEGNVIDVITAIVSPCSASVNAVLS